MLRAISPWELPAYRLYGLVVFCMKENLEPEAVEVIEEAIKACDALKSPFRVKLWQKTTTIVKRSEDGTETVETVPVVQERPIEEVKREQAHARGKPFIVPDWWVGEARAAKIALSSMGSLPKQIGGDVK